MTLLDDSRDELRRAAILRLLTADPDRRANEYVIRISVQRLGYETGTRRLRQDLSWLADRVLIRVEELDDLWVATLTAYGDDVAHGHETVAGVAPPPLRV